MQDYEQYEGDRAMKILFLTWKSFGNDDMIAAFRSLGHEVEELPYSDKDEPADGAAVKAFVLTEEAYDRLTAGLGHLPILTEAIAGHFDPVSRFDFRLTN